MFLAALAHYQCFSHHSYIDYAAGHADCCSSILQLWDISDVRQDVAEHVRYIGTFEILQNIHANQPQALIKVIVILHLFSHPYIHIPRLTS